MLTTITKIKGRKIVIRKANGYDSLSDFYKPFGRKYTGIPSVAKIGNRVWTIWQTGGDKEPHPDNYCILTYSDDLKEFKDSFIIIEAFYKNKHTNVFLPMIMSYKNELWIFFWVKGKYMAAIIKNPNANPEEIIWEEPKVLFDDYLVVTKPLIVDDEWMFFGNIYDGCEKTTILSSTAEDKRTGYKIKGEITTPLYKNPFNHCHETMAIKKNDGTYWALKRIEKGYMGGIEQAFSKDKGRTWTHFECSLNYPLIGPGSKFVLKTLNSGNILFVSHDVTDSRSKLIAHLSTNQGETFDYHLMLDERGGVSYPDVELDDDGYIYIIYDRNRMKQQEIRMAIFNEEDIKQSKFISPKSKQKLLVYKSMNYKTIMGIDEEEEINYNLQQHFSINNLPNNLTLTLEDDSKVKVDGVWEIVERAESKFARFIIRANPNYEDVFEKTKFEMEV